MLSLANHVLVDKKAGFRFVAFQVFSSSLHRAQYCCPQRCGLPEKILKIMEKREYETPFPIQMQVLLVGARDMPYLNGSAPILLEEEMQWRRELLHVSCN